jgi:hypothetical protein
MLPRSSIARGSESGQLCLALTVPVARPTVPRMWDEKRVRRVGMGLLGAMMLYMVIAQPFGGMKIDFTFGALGAVISAVFVLLGLYALLVPPKVMPHLLEAIATNEESRVEKLIGKCNLNAPHGPGQVLPIHMAAVMGGVAMLDKLVARGASPHAMAAGLTPPQYIATRPEMARMGGLRAMQIGNDAFLAQSVATLRWFAAKGVSLGEKDPQGRTLKELATASGNTLLATALDTVSASPTASTAAASACWYCGEGNAVVTYRDQPICDPCRAKIA